MEAQQAHGGEGVYLDEVAQASDLDWERTRALLPMQEAAARRWGVFHAGLASANDPKYTVVPQRERLRQRHPSGEPS